MMAMRFGYLGSYRSRATADPAAAGLVSYDRKDVSSGFGCGIVAGSSSERICCLPADSHALVFGQTGAGKTASVAAPSLLLNMSSAEQPNLIIVDCKETLWGETSAFAENCGYRVRRLDLRSSKSPCTFNPLTPAWQALERDRDQKRSDELLHDALAPLGNLVTVKDDRYWENAVLRLLTASFHAYCAAKHQEPSIKDLVDLVFLDEDEWQEIIAVLPEPTATEFIQATNLKRRGSAKTWSCILDTLGTETQFFTSAVGSIVAGSSNFDPIAELTEGEVPVALYLTVPDETAVANAYVSLLFDMLYKGFVHASEQAGREGRSLRRALCLIDEAARFPKCSLTSIMATGRSRGFTVTLLLQSFQQLLERGYYTEAEATVLVEQAGSVLFLPAASKELGDNLHVRSGGLAGARELVGLRRGEAFVTRIGHPVMRTQLLPAEELRAAYPRLRLDS